VSPPFFGFLVSNECDGTFYKDTRFGSGVEVDVEFWLDRFRYAWRKERMALDLCGGIAGKTAVSGRFRGILAWISRENEEI
jgi:hypothetical protein